MATARLGRAGQIRIYVGKCFRTFFNEKGWKSLISTVIIAVIISWIIGDKTFSVFEGTKNGVFALICGCIWTGLFNSIQSICRERAIIKREHRTGLHISSYVIAHMIFELIQSLVEAFLLTVIFAIMRDLPSEGVIFTSIEFEFFISFALVIFCADTLGIMVSCIVKTENAAMTIMPFVLIIQLVMSGSMFILPENAEFIKDLTVSKWGLCAICSSADINEYPKDIDIRAEENNIDPSLIACIVDQNRLDEYKVDYEASSQHIAETWLVLIGYSLLYSFIGILFLKTVDRDKR